MKSTRLSSLNYGGNKITGSVYRVSAPQKGIYRLCSRNTGLLFLLCLKCNQRVRVLLLY